MKLHISDNKSAIENGSFVWGKNMEVSEDGKSLRNEGGFLDIYTVPDNKTIVGYVVTPNNIIIFATIYDDVVYKETGYKTSVVRVNNDASVDVIIDSEYIKIDPNNTVHATYFYNRYKELVIVFWDGINSTSNMPSILNIDNLPFPLNINNEIDISTWPIGTGPAMTRDRASELLRLWPKVKTPNISFTSLEDGGELESGTYHIAISYIINDYETTPYYLMSEPIYVYDKEYTNVDVLNNAYYYRIKKNSNKKINIYIYNLDMVFNKIRVAVIHNNNTLGAYIIGDFAINNYYMNFSYSGKYISIENVNSIIVPKQVFNAITTGTMYDNRLLISSVKQDDYNYQPYANDIQLSVRVSILNITNNDIGTENTDITNKSMMPMEVYAVNIHLVYKTGKISDGFHIPGRAVNVYQDEFDASGISINENSSIQSYHDTVGVSLIPTTEEIDIDSSAKVFQIRDTSRYTDAPANNNLEFGFWENQNEVYPDNENFDGSIYGTNIALQKVRHHRVPSLEKISQLKFLGGSIPVGSDCAKISIGINASNIVIPNDLAPLIDGVIFSFSKRSFSNSLVLGVSPVVAHKWSNISATTDDYIRFYDFALLHDKPSISPKYIKSMGIRHDVADPLVPPNIIIDKLESFSMRAVETIKNFKYLPSDNLLALPSTIDTNGNSNRENTAFMEIDTTPNSLALTKSGSGFINWHIHMGQLFSYKEDVYFPFYSQQLAFTNSYIQIPLAGTYDEEAISGFDTFNSMSTINITDADFLSGSLTTSAKIKESTALVSGHTYRVLDPGYVVNESDVSPQQQDRDAAVGNYYPSGATVINADFANIGANMSKWKKGYEFVCIPDSALGTTPTKWGASVIMDVGGVVIRFPSFSPYNIRATGQLAIDSETIPAYKANDYNRIYGSLYDIGVPPMRNPYTTYDEYYYYQIFISDAQQSESNALALRHFLVNSYYYLKSLNKGKITALNVFGKLLFIHQLYGTSIAFIKDTMVTDKNIDGSNEIYLGKADLFDRDPVELTPTNIGKGGCLNSRNTLVTDYGYFYYDSINAILYMHDGKTLTDLSTMYVREYLDKYKADADNTTQFVSSLGYNNTTYTIYLNITNAIGLFDLNISYNVKFKHWVVLHDWSTAFIASNHNITISPSVVVGGSPQYTLYLHNQYNRPGLYYYNPGGGGGISLRDSFVDVIYNKDFDVMKEFTSFMLHTKIITNSNININLPPSFVIIYNDYQCTEKILLIAGNTFFDNANVRRIKDKWFINDFSDDVIDINSAIFDTQKLLTSNVDKNSVSWFDKSLFISNFIIVRVGYDNNDGNIFIYNGVIPKYKMLK